MQIAKLSLVAAMVFGFSGSVYAAQINKIFVVTVEHKEWYSLHSSSLL